MQSVIFMSELEPKKIINRDIYLHGQCSHAEEEDITKHIHGLQLFVCSEMLCSCVSSCLNRLCCILVILSRCALQTALWLNIYPPQKPLIQ